MEPAPLIKGIYTRLVCGKLGQSRKLEAGASFSKVGEDAFHRSHIGPLGMFAPLTGGCEGSLIPFGTVAAAVSTHALCPPAAAGRI